MTRADASAAPPSENPRRHLRPGWLAVAALSPVLLLATLFSPWPWLPALAGRSHPLLLHFPIALLFLAAVMEGIEAVTRGGYRFSPDLVLFAGAFGAVLAATCGFLLMRVDAFAGARVERHLIGGLTVAGLAVLALVVQAGLANRATRAARRGYRALLVLLCAALLITGHDGSALTHGEDYLTEHLPWNTGRIRVALRFPTDRPVEQWGAYEHVVAPIVQSRCVECHNRTNYKGKLVLDDWEGLANGGKSGALWIAGRPEDSLLVQRLLLPLDDEKHMPPRKKPQPTAEEIALLQLWVRAGAPIDGTPAVLASDPAWRTAVQKLPGLLTATSQVAAAEEPPAVDPVELARARAVVEAAFAPLRARFPWAIAYESRTSADLRVNASLLGAAFGDAEFAALSPLSQSIVDLDLSDTAITDASAPGLARMTRLRVLRLNGTRLGDATLAALAPLTELESIGLFRTPVSDAGARTLAGLPKLRRVYAAETGMSAAMLGTLPGVQRPAGDEAPN